RGGRTSAILSISLSLLFLTRHSSRNRGVVAGGGQWAGRAVQNCAILPAGALLKSSPPVSSRLDEVALRGAGPVPAPRPTRPPSPLGNGGDPPPRVVRCRCPSRRCET